MIFFTYRASVSERIEIGYLSKASPDEVVKWLKENWKEPEFGSLPAYYNDQDRRLLERLLCARNSALIDFGIARYGWSIKSIQMIYDRGDTGTRYAAVSNPYGNIRLRQSTEIIKYGSLRLMRAMVQNQFLPGQFFESIFETKEAFSDLTIDRLLMIVFGIGRNERLMRPYDGPMDGWAEFSYEKALRSAWDLTRIVPTTQPWAGGLGGLLSNCRRSYSFEGVLGVIERWRIDTPIEGKPEWFKRSPSFRVRTLLAGFLEADEQLLMADDLALRASFYERFLPSKFRNWPSFLEKDGSEFVDSALQNDNLWSNSDERVRLKEVCWACPDPQATMYIPNDYRNMEMRQRALHPKWFADTEDPALQAIAELGDQVTRLAELFQEAVKRKRGLF